MWINHKCGLTSAGRPCLCYLARDTEWVVYSEYIMTGSSSVDSDVDRDGVTVAFGEKYAGSEQFAAMFREGMALVEETAAYLDGEGRRESKELPSSASLAYATESMRLTTRLMQLASWLLIRRAVNDGEMTPEQALEEKHKVKLQTIGRAEHTDGFEELPSRLKELIQGSFRLHDRIVTLDRLIHEEPEYAGETAAHPLSTQLDKLRMAFEVETPDGK